MKGSIVITGASTGIGYAAAVELIARGYHVFGSVRKEADGLRLQKDLGVEFTPLKFDVTDIDALSDSVAIVQAAVGEKGIAALVNNAGVAPFGPLMHTSQAEIRNTFDINVFGLLAVTQAFLPLLGAGTDARHRPGRIVNLSSISGGVCFPMCGTYAASKHAVEALSDGLRRELSIYGIEVSAIEPGSIKTPIWEKTTSKSEEERYAKTDFAAAMAGMETVVEKELKKAKPIKVVVDAICHAIEAPKPKTRYPLVGLWHLRNWLSDRLIDRVLIKNFGLK